MKILCYWLCDYLTESYEQCHYMQAFKTLGHNVKVMPQDDSHDAKLLEVIDLWKPKLAFFVPHKTGGVRPETYKYISEHTSTTTFIYLGDDEKQFDIGEAWDSKHLAPNFNWIGTNHEPAVEWYKKLGYNNVIYSQYGANQAYCKKLKVKKSIDTSFIGSIKIPRINILNYLAYKGMKIQVFGNGWSEGSTCSSRLLVDDEYIEVINSSKINLDFNRDETDYGIVCQQIKGRDFEVPMCGQFLLMEHFDGIKEYFKIGSEIESFKSYEECVSKIKFYLKNDKAREKIARAGRTRALKDHTYAKRFKKLLGKIRYK